MAQTRGIIRSGNTARGRHPPTTAATTAPTLSGETTRTDRGVVPGLVLAWSDPSVLSGDRAPLRDELVVGRSSSAGWCLRDRLLSRKHFTVAVTDEGYGVRDLKSRNGTFLSGERLSAAREAGAGAVIRAGECLFVIVEDMGELAPPGGNGEAPHGIAGPFHAEPLVSRLRVAARTGRDILIEGETGTGKELAAGALHEILGELGRTGPFEAHNAAFFANEDDAVATLFGVAPGTFTSVNSRSGLLERADGGTLFLDEVHNLPLRVQRSLLRFVEDGRISRLGEGGTRPRAPSDGLARRIDVRLILGTNQPVGRAIERGCLAQDLVARFHRLSLAPLRRRRADIPGIFRCILGRTLPGALAGEVERHLDAARWERLCLHDYEDGNVRELVDLAAVVGAWIDEGYPPLEAIDRGLDDAFGPLPGRAEPSRRHGRPSIYERHRRDIIKTYDEVEGNLTHLERTLRARGLKVNRRWLTVYLDRWGIRTKNIPDP